MFVDAGANVGYFSLLAASRGAHVLAYEPTLAVYRRLKENFALNGFSGDLVNAALSDKAGTVKLYESDDDPEANSIFGNGEWSSTVRTVSLDRDLIRFGVKRVDLLKIDVEGAEPMVLDGAKKLLSSVDAPDLIIEVNAFALKAAGSAPSRFIGD